MTQSAAPTTTTTTTTAAAGTTTAPATDLEAPVRWGLAVLEQVLVRGYDALIYMIMGFYIGAALYGFLSLPDPHHAYQMAVPVIIVGAAAGVSLLIGQFRGATRLASHMGADAIATALIGLLLGPAMAILARLTA